MFRVMKRGKKRATLAVILVIALLLSNIIAPISAFALEDCYLFLCAYPSEGGTVEGDGNYTAGQEVSINAVPNPGYKFDHWEAYCGGELADPLQASTTYTVPEGTAEVMAYFVPVYELTLQADPVEGGTTAGDGEYKEMEEVQISAAAAEGYMFSGWTDTEGVLGGNVNETFASFYMPANPISLTANFVPVYELTLQADPVEGGTTAGDGKYEENEEVQISAVAAEGYMFSGWTDDGGVLADDDLEKAVVTFFMPAEAVSLTANFVPAYDLTLFANPAEGGEALDLTAGGPYEEGTEVEISAIANDGYKFVNWTATNFAHLIENVNAAITKFIMPAAHETLTANYKNYAIADLEVAVPNHTVYVPTDYTFTFESVTELNKNLGDKIFIVTDPYYAGFDYSGINPEEMPITITINGEESSYVTNASWGDEDNPQMLEINLPADIPSGSLLKFTLSGVKNPPIIGEAVPALVHIGGEGGDPLSIALEEAVEFILPSISITPVAGPEDKPVGEEDDPMEVNQRRRLIFELKDESGEPFVAPNDITGTLYSNSNGDFYNEYADVYNDDSFTILSGNSATYKYYRPLAVGNHTVDNFSGSWYPSSSPFAGGYLQATSPTIPVAPAGEVEAWMNYSQFPSIQAGSTGHFAITVENRDQYWNQTEQTRNISIMLKAVAFRQDGSPPEEGEFKGKLLLPEKDAEGNIKYDNDGNMLFVDCGDSTVIEIPEGERIVDFYYYDEKSTIWPNDYAVNIIATAENLNVLDQSVTVYPLSQSEKLVVLPMDGVEKFTGAKYELQLQVQDAFGNVTDLQPWALTVSLTSSSETGKFYSDYWLDTQITQVTLNYENVKTFYYVDTAASDPAMITAKSTDLQDGIIDLFVREPLLTVDFDNNSGEVNLHRKFGIKLQVKDGESYKDFPAPGDLTVYLGTDKGGEFFQNKADNNNPIYSIVIEEGSSSAEAYYRPVEVGTHQITATLNIYNTTVQDAGRLEVTPSGETQNRFTMISSPFTAGIPGRVDLEIRDQYNNPVTQETNKIVYPEAFAVDSAGNPTDLNGRLIKAGDDGAPLMDGNEWVDLEKDTEGRLFVEVPAGESGISFYYLNTRATGPVPDYYVYLRARAESLTEEGPVALTVNAAETAKLSISALDGEEKNTGESFMLQLELQDEFGNLSQQQVWQGPLTVALAAEETTTGKFYSDAYLQDRITQLTFQNYENVKTFYFQDKAAGNPLVKATATDLQSGSLDLRVVQPPEFTVTAASSSLEVYLHNEINIALNKSYPYDIIVYLSSAVEEDNFAFYPGTFYPSPTNNVASVDTAVIPAGETGTTVYYRSRFVGTHTILAYIDSFGGLEAISNAFTVTPAAQVTHQLGLETCFFTAGVPGQVNLEILDQYGQPVPQAGETTVYVSAYALDQDGKSADNFSGRLLKADTDGSLIGGDNAANWVDVDENGLLIPDGKSGCSFYYYDERATDDEYNVFIQTGAEHLNMDNYRQKLTVKSAPADTVRISAVEGCSRVIYDTFPLLVELVDKFGNLAAAQDEPVTIELTTDSPTGRFYSDASLTQRISQLTFDYYTIYSNFFPGQLIYYVDSNAAEKVQISGAAQTPTINARAVDLMVLPLPCSITLEEGEGDDWLVQQRRKVIVKLWNNEPESEIYDDPYTVPAELEKGLPLQLSCNPEGKFYTHLVGGEELEGNNIAVPPGASEIEVYFNPESPGHVQLAAGFSYRSEAAVFGVLNIDVSAAGRVRSILEGELHFTAGVPGEVCVALVDQYGNRTTEDSDLNVALHTSSANGSFYLSPEVDNDGKPTADAITNVLIPQGKSKAIVYYYDTKTTGGDYRLFLDVKPAGCNGDVREAFVYPADSKNLMISVWDYEEFYDLKIENQYGCLVLPGHSGEQDKLLSGMLFPVTVSIVDAMGNPVPQSTPLTVNLSAEKDDPDAPGSGKFYLDEEGTLPVTQITIGGDAGSSAALYFVAKGNKELNFALQATAPGLAKGEKTVTVLEADELRIYFPWGDNAANPEQRKPFAIVLTDAQGHPAKAFEDIQVALQGGRFFMGPEDYEDVTDVTIKAGRQGIMLFVEAGRLEGPMTIEAVAENYENAGAVLDVKHYPYYTRELFRGWNILSVPLELKYNTLADIVKDAENVIELAYYFDAVNKEWKLITTADYGDMPINPTDAVYLKLKGKTLAEFYPLESPSGPYNRTLKQGWNLFGPAFDLSDWNAHEMRASNVLSSLSGQFVHVISPRTEVQNPWAYIPGLSSNPDMRVTEGYWIYMKEEGILPGFSYTPVSGNYYGHIPCPGDDDYWGVMEMPDLTVSPPPLPAAFYGDVVDAEGNTIEEGTIEAVVDGIVRGRITFNDGRFGLSEGARLVVQSMTNLGSKKITFYVNGYRAMESFRWFDTSGYLSGVTLTVDTSTVQEGLVYKGLAVRDPYTVELTFNVNILNNLDNPDDLKGAVQFSSSLGTFLPLSEEDSVFIENDKLVIKFSRKIAGNDNEITLAANALKDEKNNVLNYNIRTAPFNTEDIVIDECFIATAAFGTKFDPAVALLRKFRDKCLLTNTLGQEFVALYYRTSPPIAAFIAGNGFLRGAVRMLLVPFIVLAYLLLNPALGLLMAAVIPALIVYRRRFRIKALH